MKIIFPNNIFSTLFILSMNEKKRPELEVKESSLILNEVKNSDSVIGLIPSLELINVRDIFVSQTIGISFENLLSNAYIYFNENQKMIDELLIRGDVSINEVLLSHLIFREKYNLKPKISLDTNEKVNNFQNYIIAGNENWLDERFKNGNSFTEQIGDLIDYSYVNFLFVSQNEKLLKRFNDDYKEVAEKMIFSIEGNLKKIGMSNSVDNFILLNLNSIHYALTDYDTTAYSELLQLLYYHQIIDDLFDVKFVQ